jgi:hypothetical protein
MLTTLRLGDQGDDVKKLQKLLNRKLLPPSHLKQEFKSNFPIQPK